MADNKLTVTESLIDLFEYLCQGLALYWDGKNTYWDSYPWDETDIKIADPQEFFECLNDYPDWIVDVIFNYDKYRFISPKKKAKIETWLNNHNEQITIEWSSEDLSKAFLEDAWLLIK